MRKSVAILLTLFSALSFFTSYITHRATPPHRHEPIDGILGDSPRPFERCKHCCAWRWLSPNHPQFSGWQTDPAQIIRLCEESDRPTPAEAIQSAAHH